MFNKKSRGGRIRTCDPLVPNQVRYRTALHPDDAIHCIAEQKNSGVGGIRTLGPAIAGQRFSKPPLSAAQAPLRWKHKVNNS